MFSKPYILASDWKIMVCCHRNLFGIHCI